VAYRYRREFFEDGDIVSPVDWNINMAEYANELNGYLDRDNFPAAAFSLSHILPETFNKFNRNSHADVFTVNTNTTGWQDNDGTTDLGLISLDCSVDSLVECAFSCWWEWAGHTLPGDVTDNDVIQFRIVVDGEEVAVSGFQSNLWKKRSVFIGGPLFISAGLHTAKAQCRVGRITPVSTATVGPKDSTSFVICQMAVDVKDRELYTKQRRR
jgi:hypothetical protein